MKNLVTIDGKTMILFNLDIENNYKVEILEKVKYPSDLASNILSNKKNPEYFPYFGTVENVIEEIKTENSISVYLTDDKVKELLAAIKNQ